MSRHHAALHGRDCPPRGRSDARHHQTRIREDAPPARFLSSPPLPSLSPRPSPFISASSALSPQSTSHGGASRHGRGPSAFSSSSSSSSSRKRLREQEPLARPGAPQVTREADPAALDSALAPTSSSSTTTTTTTRLRSYDDEGQQARLVAEKENRPLPQGCVSSSPSGSCGTRTEGDNKRAAEGRQGQGQGEEEEEEEKDECCICLCEIGEVMGCLTCCEHKFCFDCISQWAEKCNTCPLCKQRFREIIKKSTAPQGGGRQRQQQGAKKPRTERVRVRSKDYNPWSDEEDDDSEDDDLDDDVQWPSYGVRVNSFVHHTPSFHTHYHHPGGLFPYPHNLHAMGLYDMFTNLFPTSMTGVISPYHQRATSTYMWSSSPSSPSSSSSSSGDELGGSDSPEVIVVDSDGEDTLERGRASRAPGLLPPRHYPGSSQEIIDLTLLPDSEDEDNGSQCYAQRTSAVETLSNPPLPTVINLDAAPSPVMYEHHHPVPTRDDEQRRHGGRIADIIHERNV